MTTQTVSTSGSGLVFHNTYTANCSQQYINCIVAAEQQLERLWTNSVTINITFDEVAKGTNDFLATNSWTSWVNVNYTQLHALGRNRVLNDCDDHSAEIVNVASTRHDGLQLHVVDVWFPLPWAHVGSARRLAMERALNIGGPHSVLFSTDADATPAAGWIDASLRIISAGADLVGGNIIGDKGEETQLGKGFIRRATHHLEYAGLVNHLKSLIDPDPHDPWPRHVDHTGASLAVRGDVYGQWAAFPRFLFVRTWRSLPGPLPGATDSAILWRSGSAYRRGLTAVPAAAWPIA